MHFSNPLLFELPATILASLKDFIADLVYNPCNEKYQSPTTIIFEHGYRCCKNLIKYVTPDVVFRKEIKCIRGYWSKESQWEYFNKKPVNKYQRNHDWTFFFYLFSPNIELMFLMYIGQSIHPDVSNDGFGFNPFYDPQPTNHHQRCEEPLLKFMRGNVKKIKNSPEYRAKFDHILKRERHAIGLF